MPDTEQYNVPPFAQLLEMQNLKREPGKAQCELLIGNKHLRSLNMLHGGVTATLLDSMMGAAAGTTAPDQHFVVTVQLNVNYIRPAWHGEQIITKGEVIHSGEKTAVARGEIYTSTEELVASGSGTFMYIPRYESKDPPKTVSPE